MIDDGLVSLFVLSFVGTDVVVVVCITVNLPLLLFWVFNLLTDANDELVLVVVVVLLREDNDSFEWPFNDSFNWFVKGGELLLVVLVELVFVVFKYLKKHKNF